MNDEDFSELIDTIKNSSHFSKVTGSGFYTLKCPVCNDYKVRAGFKFEDNTIGYNCFRGKCNVGKTKWVRGNPIPKKMRQILGELEIEIPISLLVSKSNNIKNEINDLLYEKPSFPNMEIPSIFIRFDKEKHKPYRDYLLERHMSCDDEYYICHEGTWKNMLIVPFYLNGKLIGWHGRDIYKKRFNTSSSNLIYCPNGYIPDNPIIVEGVWDAKSVPNGVAILHDNISKSQAYLLRDKNPILLPDKNVSEFLVIAKRYGWRISIPDWRVKDPNEALLSYGRLVIAKMIHDNTFDDLLEAETKYNMWAGG